MSTEQLVSITDLRKNTSTIFKSLINGPKFILSNNKMEAVIISPTEYQFIRDYMKARELEENAKQALKAKGFTNGKDLLSDLLKD
ncbi:hypothetical protein AGMMS50249_3390 [candidate division SR1 bacterium]|nr:hypothetical protein AGMMS50249_3390 [candidate division SR1 bacterium]